MVRLIDEKGNRYGRLIVIERFKNDKHRQAQWLCRCDCGNSVVVRGGHLRSGTTRSCGCFNREQTSKARTIDLTGHVYGRLTVIKKHGLSKSGSIAWLCKCDCGNETIVSSNHLRKGNTKSCGCLHREIISLPLGVAAFNDLFSRIRKNARVRDLEWTLTKEQVRFLTKRPCHYCGVAPSQVHDNKNLNGVYVYNGLDRIDNDEGYTITNVVPCCKVCNRAKFNMTSEEFEIWVARAHAYIIVRLAEHVEVYTP